MYNFPIRWGIIILFIFFGVFGIWATVAPIDSAAVCQGTVILDSDIKKIQHFEGGIVETISVSEGDYVEANQTLIVLSKTAAQANLELLYNQLRVAVANETRLVCEQTNRPRLVFNNDLLIDRSNPQIKTILNTQQNLFLIHRRVITNRINILKKQIKQILDEIDGIKSQKESTEKQFEIVLEEFNIVEKLVNDGNETRARLMMLQKERIALQGNLGELISAIAKANQSISQIEIEILRIKNDRQNEITSELHEVQVGINDLKERVIAATDVLNRLVIIAPRSGVVAGLKVHTIGGVIPPGSEIMTIVPQDDKLIIEAKLNTQDIDVVETGLIAKVRLLAYRTRYTPLLIGRVINVSPDKCVEPTNGQSYYLIRVQVENVDSENICRVGDKEFELYPGMPVEALVVTGSRSFFSYLLDPIKKTFRKSFRED